MVVPLPSQQHEVAQIWRHHLRHHPHSHLSCEAGMVRQTWICGRLPESLTRRHGGAWLKQDIKLVSCLYLSALHLRADLQQDASRGQEQAIDELWR